MCIICHVQINTSKNGNRGIGQVDNNKSIKDQMYSFKFQHYQATARVWAEMARALSDTMVIPFDVVNFANELLSLVNTLDEDYGTMLRNQSIIFGKKLSILFINFTHLLQ